MKKLEKNPKHDKNFTVFCPILQIQQNRCLKRQFANNNSFEANTFVPDILMTLQIHDKVPKIPDFSSKLDCRKNDKNWAEIFRRAWLQALKTGRITA